MTLYSFALSLHVVTAILGLGQVAGVVALASTMSSQGRPGPTLWTGLQRLTLGTRVSLGVMMLSGVLLEYVFAGAHRDMWWFRLSFLLLIVLGVINARMQRALRQRESAGEEQTLKGIVRGGWAMCVVVAVVAILMEVKPW